MSGGSSEYFLANRSTSIALPLPQARDQQRKLFLHGDVRDLSENIVFFRRTSSQGLVNRIEEFGYNGYEFWREDDVIGRIALGSCIRPQDDFLEKLTQLSRGLLPVGNLAPNIYAAQVSIRPQ